MADDRWCIFPALRLQSHSFNGKPMGETRVSATQHSRKMCRSCGWVLVLSALFTSSYAQSRDDTHRTLEAVRKFEGVEPGFRERAGEL